MRVKKIVSAIEEILPVHRPIEHHEPAIGIEEIDAATACLKAGISTNYWVGDLEEKLAKYCRVKHAVCTSSGTTALQLSLLALEVQPNDEVIVPAMTFSATATAVCHVGAVPHFVDGFPSISADKLRSYLDETTTEHDRGRLNTKTGRVISAIIVVDLLGFPADWMKLDRVAKDFKLSIIEDAAQALGSSLRAKRCGSYGDLATLSFNNNKIVTGNGGGAVLTNNDWYDAKIRQLSSTARIKHPWLISHTEIAYNYRMPNVCAAIACAQMDKLDSFLMKKSALFFKACLKLSNFDEFYLLVDGTSTAERPNHWLLTILLEKNCLELRDELLQEMHNRGIRSRALFTPLHYLDMFSHCPKQEDLEAAEFAFNRAICLPSGVA